MEFHIEIGDKVVCLQRNHRGVIGKVVKKVPYYHDVRLIRGSVITVQYEDGGNLLHVTDPHPLVGGNHYSNYPWIPFDYTFGEIRPDAIFFHFRHRRMCKITGTSKMMFFYNGMGEHGSHIRGQLIKFSVMKKATDSMADVSGFVLNTFTVTGIPEDKTFRIDVDDFMRGM